MKGKTIGAFIEALYDNPEMELLFHGNRYLVSGWVDAEDKNYTLELWNVTLDCMAFQRTDAVRERCVTEFEKAPIFDGLTIYQAEQEIEVLFG